ncbi:MAG: hypothetical protein ACREYF_22540 [Gammaproteobacteria bacterium]
MISTGNEWREERTVLLAVVCAVIGLCPGQALAADEGPNICGKTTRQLLKACRLQADDDARVGTAICLNLSDGQASEDCKIATQEARSEALAKCRDVREARDEVCADFGPGPYDPVIDPANFVSEITNPYAPFRPGAFWEYKKQTAEGLEEIRVEVLDETREILGVTVTTLRDTVTLAGEVIEDTIDWVAQDVDGNVWYFGEISKNFEDGLLANLDGSFEAGKDGAKPGILIKARPQVGEVYRIEYALSNEAEDIAEVLSLDATDTDVPFSEEGSGPVLKTLDTTPLSPVAEEHKYYVPGIGFVLEVDPETGERLELVDFGPR